ncbi:MAG: hypothetical protein V1756_02530 [Patescibacteria group bacterium]
MKAEELKKEFYDAGKFTEGLAAVIKALQDSTGNDDPEWPNLLALKAWFHYRLKDYALAQDSAKEAGPVLWARECLAYIAAYVDKDDAALRQFLDELGDNINVTNAMIIRARDNDSTIAHGEVLMRTLLIRGEGVETANLYHNAGRYFLAKPRDDSDYVLALGFFTVAAALYGTTGNWHHRGALAFWRSSALEHFMDKKSAISAVEDSLRCWTEAIALDPTNKQHLEKWQGAINRLSELRK